MIRGRSSVSQSVSLTLSLSLRETYLELEVGGDGRWTAEVRVSPRFSFAVFSFYAQRNGSGLHC